MRAYDGEWVASAILEDRAHRLGDEPFVTSPDGAVTYAELARAAARVPVNTDFKGEFLDHVVGGSGAKLLVVDAHRRERAERWNQPRAPIEAFRNLWFHTGDGGYLDDEGHVVFTDRVKDSPRFMVPRYVRVMDALPKTPSQRIEKYRLREAGVTPDTFDREAAGLAVPRS